MSQATITQRTQTQPERQQETAPTSGHWYRNTDSGELYLAADADAQTGDARPVNLFNIISGKVYSVTRGGFGKGGASAFEKLDVTVDWATQ